MGDEEGAEIRMGVFIDAMPILGILVHDTNKIYRWVV